LRIVVVAIDVEVAAMIVVVVAGDISDPVIYLVNHGPQTERIPPRSVKILVQFGREFVSLDCLDKVDAIEIEPFVPIV
jgi:hypothetical protein